MYGVEQSFTSPYKPRGNAFCECFNRTLFGLLKTLKAEEKADLPSHLPALVKATKITHLGINRPVIQCFINEFH